MYTTQTPSVVCSLTVYGRITINHDSICSFVSFGPLDTHIHRSLRLLAQVVTLASREPLSSSEPSYGCKLCLKPDLLYVGRRPLVCIQPSKLILITQDKTLCESDSMDGSWRSAPIQISTRYIVSMAKPLLLAPVSECPQMAGTAQQIPRMVEPDIRSIQDVLHGSTYW